MYGYNSPRYNMCIKIQSHFSNSVVFPETLLFLTEKHNFPWSSVGQGAEVLSKRSTSLN